MNRTIYAVVQRRIDRVDVGKGRVNNRAKYVVTRNSTSPTYLHPFPLLLSVARYINPNYKHSLML